MTKKSSTVPINQCPICKSKVPKRSLNTSAKASKLCTIYEEIVRSYSEINGGNEDWMHEAGIRGNDAYYTGGGVALDNLTQLYPYAEKPKPKPSKSSSQTFNIIETEGEDVEEDDDIDIDTQLQLPQENNEISRIFDETTQLEDYESSISSSNDDNDDKVVDDLFSSSPLIYNEPDQDTQITGNDRLIINTQELEKLAAINDSIDRELAELEMKLAENGNNTKNDYENKEDMNNNNNDVNNYKIKNKKKHKSLNVSDKEKMSLNADFNLKTDKNESIKSKASSITSSASSKPIGVKVKVYSNKKNDNFATKRPEKSMPIAEDSSFGVEDYDRSGLKAITTTAVKDENSLLLLTNWSDLFNIQIHPNLNSTTGVTHLIIPTGPDLIVKKRTIKYFEALLLGNVQIISFQWIEACLNNLNLKQKRKQKEPQLVDPRAFRIKGDEIGLSRTTIATTRDLSNLFSSLKFYFYGNFIQPPRDQLEKLIKASNSKILNDTKELTRGAIVLADPISQFTFEQDAETIRKYPIVSPNWLLDSISCGAILDFHGYLVL